MSATPSTPGPDEGPPPPTRASPDATTGATSTGLSPELACLLAYLVGWVSGLILLLVEKEHREVRFHAAQSILVSVALIGLYLVLGVLTAIPVLGLIFALASLVVGLASLALWVYLLIQGYQLNHVRLPIVGKLADDWTTR